MGGGAKRGSPAWGRANRVAAYGHALIGIKVTARGLTTDETGLGME